VAIDPRLAGYSPQQLPALYSRLLDRLDSVPGVESTAIAMCGILVGCRSAEDGLSIEGYQSRPGEQVLVLNNVVSSGYFETVGMRLVSGRLLNERDPQGAQKVAVVNEAFVRRYFAGGEPLGKKFGYKTMDQEIVGVVEDARFLNVKEAPDPTAFFPFDQRPVVPHHVEIRTSGDPGQIANAVRQAIFEVEPNLPVEGVMTLSERVQNNLSQERLLLSLTSAFAALALGLAGFGLFGLLSYAVARRTADLGIRLALGASRGSVLWAVLRESLLLAFAGIAVGLPLVIAGSRLMSGLLFGISPHDGATIVTAVGVLVFVAAVSGLLPAWRASRVDPLSALRFE
jgi:predicted permease